LNQPDSINKIVDKLKGFFAFVFDVMGTIAGGIMKGLNLLPGVNIDNSLIKQVQTGGSMIRSMNLGGLTVSEAAAKSETGGGGGGSSAPNNAMASSGTSVFVKMEGNVDYKLIETQVGVAAPTEGTKIVGPVNQ
jgi:hypothetical protein